MTPHYQLCRLAVFAMASLVISPIVLSQQETESKIAQASTAEAYPNTAEGLHRLLKDLLLTAKNDDQTKLWSQIAEMEIPNYESWFTHMFGQEKGESLAGPYGKSLQTTELQFQMLWMELAKQEGEISIEKVDTTKRYATLTGPLDEYRADWKKTDASVGPDRQSIGLFYFVDGKFRLNGYFHDVRILSASKGGPVVAAKLINRVQPVYPEVARQLRIQGTVALNVIVRKDGTVTVQNVAGGHPLLAPAAVEAVQQWRYEPTMINGEPVDVQTKIYVNFALTKRQSEQK
jgi:TonB family protein